MLHDTIMSLVVVVVIIALAVIWKFTSDDGRQSAPLGPLYADQADPATMNFVPRPDWFFYFLFYLLRIFKWPETVVLGTVGIPTILLMLLIGAAVLRPAARAAAARRPVAMVAAILVIISMGVADLEGRDREGGARLRARSPAVPRVGARSRASPTTRTRSRAQRSSPSRGCLNCHTYLGAGSANLGAPEPERHRGAKGRGVEFFKSYVSNPAQYGNNVMISYGYLGDENLTKLATFLDASRGGG